MLVVHIEIYIYYDNVKDVLSWIANSNLGLTVFFNFECIISICPLFS
jgi:hypothetical protein